MEALLFAIDVFAMVLLLISVMRATKSKGDKDLGLFGYKATRHEAPPGKPAKEKSHA